jgi:hypothetical protein
MSPMRRADVELIFVSWIGMRRSLFTFSREELWWFAALICGQFGLKDADHG